MHGYSSATVVHDIAELDPSIPWVMLYVGDFDPSGMHMSESDLPRRLEMYGGDHIEVERIALHRWQCSDLPSFRAEEKKGDKRYSWFAKNYGHTCWELDAMDPNELRDIVKDAIEENIEDREAWERCQTCQEAEQQSLKTVLDKWSGA
jgi:hypothetical protein